MPISNEQKAKEYLIHMSRVCIYCLVIGIPGLVIIFSLESMVSQFVHAMISITLCILLFFFIGKEKRIYYSRLKKLENESQ